MKPSPHTIADLLSTRRYNNTMINLLTALSGEARPLISALRLKRLNECRAFACYEGEYQHHPVHLVVSQPGILAAATATAWLQGYLNGLQSAWLNIGIAGHGYLPVGSGLLAHKITDRQQQQHWYPTLTFTPPCPTATVISADHPETAYREDALYDMEAAGFVAAASRFSVSELVHCFKIVSDNDEAGQKKLDSKDAGNLIGARMTSVLAIMEQLLQTRDTIVPAWPGYQETLQAFLSRWHFSRTRQHRLERLLQRHYVLLPEKQPDPADWAHCKKSSDVITQLAALLDAAPVTL